MVGIHRYEFSIDGAGEAATYSLRTRDIATTLWGETVTGTADDLNRREAFTLDGSISDFPAQFASLSAIDWTGLEAVGWPDAGSIYARSRELTESVGGRMVKAHYFGLQDGTLPMDLIIGDGNKVIAAIDIRKDIVMVRRGYENFTTVKHWRDSSISQPVNGYRALDMVMMPTRDGRGLATLVYLPNGEARGPFPTIFVRTPYGITDAISVFGQYATRGYAVVLQAVGGTAYWDPEARSEGEWNAMIQEPADGADALDWITRQPWSNGEICMQGGSYLGYTQWAAAKASNPALKCMIPEVSMGSAFSDQPFMGGTFVQGFAYYAFWMLDRKILPGRNWIDIMHHRPLSDIDVYATGEDLPVWNRLFDHWRNDAFWAGQNWYAGDHDRNFGTFQISGWFDDDFPGTRSNWALMSRKGTRPNRLLLGPWRHGYNADRRLNGFSFGIDALRDDIWLLKQRWYDHFLKGIDNGVTEPVVDYFVMGENTWRTSDSWPPSNASEQQWYFHSSGAANRNAADGRLKGQAPEDSQPTDSYVYDPLDPASNWYSFDLMESWADVQSYPYDFKDIELRHDVATYTSAVLTEDLTIAGNIKVILYASTDVRDTDWWAYLSDVTPTNQSNRLTVGALRARFRDLEDTTYHVFGSNFESERFLSGDPAEVVRYEISIPSVANTFRKGHRIRIAIMNAHDNYSFPNSNTGGEEGFVTDTIAGNMAIHHSGTYPSHVILPVMPSEE
jgi:putative CocE/NonD family hydrolase